MINRQRVRFSFLCLQIVMLMIWKVVLNIFTRNEPIFFFFGMFIIRPHTEMT